MSKLNRIHPSAIKENVKILMDELINMARALQKHIARQQDQTFADWFAELKELAGERWADVADHAPTIYAV